MFREFLYAKMRQSNKQVQIFGLEIVSEVENVGKQISITFQLSDSYKTVHYMHYDISINVLY